MSNDHNEMSLNSLSQCCPNQICRAKLPVTVYTRTHTHTLPCRKAGEVWLCVSTCAVSEASVKAETAKWDLRVFGHRHTHQLTSLRWGLRAPSRSRWSGNELALKTAGKVPSKLHIYPSPQPAPGGSRPPLVLQNIGNI